MRTAGHVLMLLLFLATGAYGANSREQVAPFDSNSDGVLDKEEIIRLFLTIRGLPDSTESRKLGADFAADMLSFRCSACTTVTIDDAVGFLDEKDRKAALERAIAEDKKRRIGWRGLGFGRFVVDTVNPRPTKFKAPFILSYRHDSEGKDKDQLNVLGGLQLWKGEWDFNDESTLTLATTPGIDFDVVGSKAAAESTITAGIPVFIRWVFDSRAVESITLGLKPKFSTDRAFNREVPELNLSFTFTSPAIGAGVITPNPVIQDNGRLPPWGLFWEPAFEVETGEVRDAAGNEKLTALEPIGSYERVVPRIKVMIFPYALSERLRFTGEYFYRFDPDENWERPYGEARLDYDLVMDGSLELSVVYRHGRKPPAFEDINDVLVGIGIRQ